MHLRGQDFHSSRALEVGPQIRLADADGVADAVMAELAAGDQPTDGALADAEQLGDLGDTEQAWWRE
jgi:hypothetical protein